MFNLRRPTAAAIRAQIAAASDSEVGARILAIERRGYSQQVPFLFAHDSSASLLGHGESVFEGARQEFEKWTMFDLGWVRVANPEARIASGQLVAVEVLTMGLWSVNVSRIREVVDSARCFGFVYATTELHVEEGEERFVVEFDAESGAVAYKLEAVSRPKSSLARLGFPITRSFQRRFARDSHLRMRGAMRPAKLIP